MLRPYERNVYYYETDKMGITHHSNYIRWMEEARVDFLSQIGWEFAKLEAIGIVSPVLGVTCDYKLPTKFSDKVSIKVYVKAFKGVKLFLDYEMKNVNVSSPEYGDMYSLIPNEVHAHAMQKYVEDNIANKTGIEKTQVQEAKDVKQVHNKSFAMAEIVKSRYND